MKAGYEEQRIKKKGTKNGKREGDREHCNTEHVSLKFSEKDVYIEVMEQVSIGFSTETEYIFLLLLQRMIACFHIEKELWKILQNASHFFQKF